MQSIYLETLNQIFLAVDINGFLFLMKGTELLLSSPFLCFSKPLHMLCSSWDHIWTKYLVHCLLYLMEQLNLKIKLEVLECLLLSKIKHDIK